MRFTYKLGDTFVTDTLKNERHEYPTSDAAWFGRGELERKHKAPVVTTPKKQQRLAELAERKQAGVK